MKLTVLSAGIDQARRLHPLGAIEPEERELLLGVDRTLMIGARLVVRGIELVIEDPSPGSGAPATTLPFSTL